MKNAFIAIFLLMAASSVYADDIRYLCTVKKDSGFPSNGGNEILGKMTLKSSSYVFKAVQVNERGHRIVCGFAPTPYNEAPTLICGFDDTDENTIGMRSGIMAATYAGSSVLMLAVPFDNGQKRYTVTCEKLSDPSSP